MGEYTGRRDRSGVDERGRTGHDVSSNMDRFRDREKDVVVICVRLPIPIQSKPNSQLSPRPRSLQPSPAQMSNTQVKKICCLGTHRSTRFPLRPQLTFLFVALESKLNLRR